MEVTQLLPPPRCQLFRLLWATKEKHWEGVGRGSAENREARGGGNSNIKNKKIILKSRLKKDASPVWAVWDLCKTSD